MQTKNVSVWPQTLSMFKNIFTDVASLACSSCSRLSEEWEGVDPLFC